jgi:hypothetical protein
LEISKPQFDTTNGENMNSKLAATFVLISALTLGCGESWAGSGRAVARAASKAMSKQFAVKPLKGTAPKDFKAIYARDRKIDRMTPAKPSSRDRVVERYTTMKQAQHERQHGIGKNVHMTSDVHRGRPYSAEGARKRFGIAGQVEAKETIRIPKGHPTRSNMVQGGARGVRETTSPKALPKKAVLAVKPVHSSNSILP